MISTARLQDFPKDIHIFRIGWWKWARSSTFYFFRFFRGWKLHLRNRFFTHLIYIPPNLTGA